MVYNLLQRFEIEMPRDYYARYDWLLEFLPLALDIMFYTVAYSPSKFVHIRVHSINWT